MIKASNNELPIARVAELLGVSRSGYYDYLKRKPNRKQLEQQELDKHILSIFHEVNGKYGYRRIYQELVETYAYAGSDERIRRRMKYLNICAKTKRKFKHTTDSEHNKAVYPNLVNQDFKARQMNEIWVSDITYIRTQEGWLYLAVVLDLYSRKVIGWSFGKRINRHLVCRALEMALFNRNYPENVIIHSDRGSQYCSNKYHKMLKTYKLKGSMSAKGSCYDNAVAESFFHTLKVEHVYDFTYKTRKQAKRSIFWYIEAFYNRKRRHSTIGYVSPMHFEQNNVYYKNAA